MRGIGRFITVLLWIAIAVALIWVAISNRTPVLVGFAWTPWLIETKLYLVFFFGILIGLVIAGTVTGWFRLQSFVARRQAERRAKALEKDMDTLAEEAYRTTADAAQGAAAEPIEGPKA